MKRKLIMVPKIGEPFIFKIRCQRSMSQFQCHITEIMSQFINCSLGMDISETTWIEVKEVLYQLHYIVNDNPNAKSVFDKFSNDIVSVIGTAP